MLSNGPVVEEVLFSPDQTGRIPAESLKSGSALVVMSSIPVETCRVQAPRLAARGVDYVDAPVSGGEPGARDGTLAIMAGGEHAVIERLADVFAAMGRVTHIGPVGTGQMTKLANQIIVGGTIAAVAEALHFATRGGADPAAVRRALMGGFADSKILNVLGERMIERNFVPGSPAEYQLKDMRTAQSFAGELGLHAHIARLPGRYVRRYDRPVRQWRRCRGNPARGGTALKFSRRGHEGAGMSGRVTLTVRDGIGQIVLDRPDKMNAITPDMTRELQRVCREIDDNGDIRVATIAGAGERAFSAGSDLNTLVDLSDMLAFRDRVEYAALVRDIRKPVIAALKGWVLGGGMEIAIAADIRIAGRSAKIGGPEITRGWLGGGGASQMLPRLVGVGQAMRLLLTGDPVDAETALRIGLVEEVVDDADVAARALALAKKIASFSPVATQAVKAAIRAALSMPLETGLRYENELHVLCMSDKARLEGIKAFQEKRDAKF